MTDGSGAARTSAHPRRKGSCARRAERHDQDLHTKINVKPNISCKQGECSQHFFQICQAE